MAYMRAPEVFSKLLACKRSTSEKKTTKGQTDIQRHFILKLTQIVKRPGGRGQPHPPSYAHHPPSLPERHLRILISSAIDFYSPLTDEETEIQGVKLPEIT